jgi:hypothetical protein
MNLPDELKLSRTEAGLHLGNPTKKPPWIVDPSTFWEVVPSFTVQDIHPAVTPRAPYFPTEVSDLELLRFFGGWASSWYLREYGVESRYNQKSDYRRWKNREHFKAGAHYLRDQGIAPANWLEFFGPIWVSGNLDSPTLRPLLNIRTLKKFASQAKRIHLGGEVVTTPSYTELVNSQTAMMTDLCQRRPGTREEISKIVDQHFPSGAHSILVLKAKTEAELLRGGWQSRLAKFEWIW